MLVHGSAKQVSEVPKEMISWMMIRMLTLGMSVVELDGDYVNLLKDLYQKPVIPIGLLPPRLQGILGSSDSSGDSSKHSNSEMFHWLDRQQPKTVVYVSFGSEYKMSVDEIHELAFALETSKLPFLWVLRKPEGIDQSSLLPSGFEDRIRGRGFMCFGWISQVKVLSHTAIGGSLCHCGSSSISENLFFGHSQILMPMILDQGINAKFLAEKGLGFEVERNEDGSFTRDAVKKAMRIVMVEPEGQQLRQKAAEMSKNIFSNHELHEDYVRKFISSLGQLLGK
ncbi:soyasaponin III rhamnosyltransferase-like [Papaver somniferum]|uniref:soyasaponin III rhamnosyltransferase-like n=1 Tax=Papaver somniferum TaxID=3469 RepID=UPI000E6F7909|nr:soyasaponin III rhamnosyltransferase-like [Papaver somniferum]